MAKQTPEQVAATWAQRLAGSTDKIKAGVQATTVAPGQAAARNKTGYVNGVQSAADKWAARVSSVSLQEWQAATVEKGVTRIAQGAQASQGKMANVMAQLLPHIDTVVNGLPQRGTLEQNIARSAAMIRGMSNFRRR